MLSIHPKPCFVDVVFYPNDTGEGFPRFGRADALQRNIFPRKVFGTPQGAYVALRYSAYEVAIEVLIH